MNSFYIYLIQSGISLTLLFIIYWLFLRKDTFYKLNRYYLLISLVASFLFPLFKINLTSGQDSQYYYLLETVIVTPGNVAKSIQGISGLYQLISILYIIGLCFFLFRFLNQLLQTYLLIRRNGIKYRNGVRMVVVNEKLSPFSFFNLVFINEGLLADPKFEKILEHEKTHINQKHSVDLIIAELILIMQWFNPFIWIYKKSLKSIHEYLADEGVLSSGYNTVAYQQLLLNQSMGIQFSTISNNLNHSLIKKRFIMMSRSKTNKVALLKMLIVLPAAILFTIVFTFSFTEKVLAQTETDKAVIQQKSTDNITESGDKQIFTLVETMPDFRGGPEGRIKYIAENIRYPEEARKNGISGTVFITFVIEKDGKVTNAKVLRGIGGGCDEEALKVISSMPDWIPGIQRGKAVRVQFNMPVYFKLDKGATKKVDKDSKDNTDPSPVPEAQ
ncbi:MAG: TonB family protein [Bacteroidales bacterium]|nr:TonB family protein [Bacteroidales bacterium]